MHDAFTICHFFVILAKERGGYMPKTTGRPKIE